MDKVTFTPNVPVSVALKFPEGRQVEGRFGDQMYYSLVDGRAMYLDMPVAAKINALEVKARETFIICKRHSGKRGDPIQWDVWRPDPDQHLPAPPAAVQSGAPAAPANGNGRVNGGNGAPRVYVPVDGGFIPPTKIPMNQAVIDAVRMVQTAMRVTGEQWSDDSRQGLVSTILIASERQGWLAVWEREVLQ